MNIRKIVTFKYLLNRNYCADTVLRNNLFGRTARSDITKAINEDIFNMEKEKDELLKSLPELIDVQLSQCRLNEIPETRDRMKLILKENLNGGKLFRGVSTVLAYKYVEAPENITGETLKVAHTLGWCTELLQTYFLILDDIMDNSMTRRSKPCWYRRADTGLGLAINDSIFIYSFLLEILKNNVGQSQNYQHFIDIFNESLLYSSMGQYLDIVTSERNKDYSLFTVARHSDIIKYKTAHYTYKLPVTLGILLADQMHEETREVVEKISLDLGKMFQIQDDYIDCFGDNSKTGKIGTDIQEGKCSWLAVKALEMCNNRQLTVFTACYGSKEPAHIERVKQLYKELHLPHIYMEEEKAIYNNLLETIRSVDSDGVRKMFLKLLDLTHMRKQ